MSRTCGLIPHSDGDSDTFCPDMVTGISAGVDGTPISAKERDALNTNTTHTITDKFERCIEMTG